MVMIQVERIVVKFLVCLYYTDYISLIMGIPQILSVARSTTPTTVQGTPGANHPHANCIITL